MSKSKQIPGPLPMGSSSAVPPPPDPPRVPWHIVVLVMDKIDEVEKAHIPLKEVTSFLYAHSRLDLKIRFLTFNDKHAYTGPYADNRFVLYWGALAQKWLDLITEPCRAAVALYALGVDEHGNTRNPGQGGSTWALRDGVIVNGTRRIWSSIPTDQWYFVNVPFGGFQSWAAQIVTHEIVNGISGTQEAVPYSLGPLTGTSNISAEFEAQRLASIRPEFYRALGV